MSAIHQIMTSLNGSFWVSTPVLVRAEATGERYLGPDGHGCHDSIRGNILIPYRRSASHPSAASDMYLTTSSDLGVTFSEPVKILDRTLGSPSHDYTAAYLSHFSDVDELVMVSPRNTNTTGVATDSMYYVSNDGGATFGSPVTLPDGSQDHSYASSEMHRFGATWLIGGYRGPAAGPWESGAWRSVDSGSNWTWVAISAASATDNTTETDFRELADGSLMALVRSEIAEVHPLTFRSWDVGATWHRMIYRPTVTVTGVLNGVQPDFIESNGMLLATARSNGNDRAMSLITSPDYGETWNEIYQAVEASGGDFMAGTFFRIGGGATIWFPHMRDGATGAICSPYLSQIHNPRTVTPSPVIPTVRGAASFAILDAPASGAVSAVSDVGASGITITPANVTGVSPTKTLAGSARVFEPSATGKLTIGTSASLTLLHTGAQFTLAWLVKAENVVGNTMLWLSNSGSSSNNGIFVSLDNLGGVGGTKALRYLLRKGVSSGGGISTANYSYDNAWKAGEWTWIAVVHDGTASDGSWKIYVNNRLIASPTTTVDATAGNSHSAPYIGQYPGHAAIAQMRSCVILPTALTGPALAGLRKGMWAASL